LIKYEALFHKFYKVIKKKRRDYSPGAVAKAVQAVKSGLNMRQAEKEFGVPKATINDHKQNDHIGDSIGQSPVLSKEEEELLIQHVQLMVDWGFPFSGVDLRFFVQAYLNKLGAKTRFVDNLPTSKWVFRFLGRHPEYTMRRANTIKRARAAMSREDVQDFFCHFTEAADGVLPENMLNYDQTNFSDNPWTKKCLFKKGTKHCEKVKDPLHTCMLM
jgi:hypothetical protein